MNGRGDEQSGGRDMAEYRIDELAQAAGSTVRNIRAYQDRGLLPPPRLEGRVGLYGDSHLARLRLIGKLLGRGYTFAIIKDLVSAWETGKDVGDVLGLEKVLTDPWSDEIPGTASHDELIGIFAGGWARTSPSGCSRGPSSWAWSSPRGTTSGCRARGCCTSAPNSSPPGCRSNRCSTSPSRSATTATSSPGGS